jgi:small subunit ribosomal protein S3
MGQKVNPVVFRLGLTQQWSSKWYSGKEYSQLLEQDIKIRKYLKTKIKEAGIDRIEIERSRGEITINITVAKPGLVIGRGGTGIEDLKKIIAQKFLPPKVNLKINVVEVDKINLSPGAVLQLMAADIEKRIAFRRVMKQTIEKVMKAGAEGVKIVISGRLNGAEIARRETLTQGKIPLHTLRANIAYSRGIAQTTYGTIGLKIWIYKGLQFEAKEANKVKREEIKQK